MPSAIRVLDRLDELAGDVSIPGAASGDILYRGASKWQNLPKGSNGQVLALSGGLPVWASLPPDVGFANPMTTAGDLIVGGASGAAGRLAIGAAGTILVGGSTPAWSGAPTLSGALTVQGQILAADGSTAAPSISFANVGSTGLKKQTGSGGLVISSGNVDVVCIRNDNFRLGSAIYFGWASGSPDTTGSDLTLYRDAADTLAQRRSTNAQSFLLYNTYTDASNYERAFFRWVSNALEIGTEKAGTGVGRDIKLKPIGDTSQNGNIYLSDGGNVSALRLYFSPANNSPTAYIGWPNKTNSGSGKALTAEGENVTFGAGGDLVLSAGGGGLGGNADRAGGTLYLSGGRSTGAGVPGSIIFRTATASATGLTYNALSNRWEINAAGHLLASTDNSWDIGADGANRPRTIFAGTGIKSPVAFSTGDKGGGISTFGIGWQNGAGSYYNDLRWDTTRTAFYVRSGAGFGLAGSINWYSGTEGSSAFDISLLRDGAGILAQRNGTTVQIKRIYETFTDASNYARLSIITAAGDYSIKPEAAGTGTLRGLVLVASGGKLGFYGVAAVTRQVLATGAGATVDNVITALQNLGLVSQT